MNQNIKLVKRFGTFLASGEEGNKFRFCEIEPEISKGRVVVLDFEGVENMTDSFSNACFGNLFFNHDLSLKGKVRFVNCSPLIKDFILSAKVFAAHKAKVK